MWARLLCAGWGGGGTPSHLTHLMLKTNLCRRKQTVPDSGHSPPPHNAHSEILGQSSAPKETFLEGDEVERAEPSGLTKRMGYGACLYFLPYGSQQSVYTQHRTLREPNQCQWLLNMVVPATTKAIQFSGPTHPNLGRKRRHLFLCWFAC